MSTKGITEADKHADAKTHYADIFSLPHWEPSSTKPSGLLSHPRMDITNRAAMFASFDALVGYKEAVSETARTTDGRIELSDGELEELNRRLGILIDRMKEGAGNPLVSDDGEQPSNIVRADSNSSPTVSITYFVPDQLTNPDSKKDGGSYVTVTGQVRKIDLFQRLLFFADNSGSLVHLDGKAVNIDDVVKIDGEIFDQYSSSYE